LRSVKGAGLLAQVASPKLMLSVTPSDCVRSANLRSEGMLHNHLPPSVQRLVYFGSTNPGRSAFKKPSSVISSDMTSASGSFITKFNFHLTMRPSRAEREAACIGVTIAPLTSIMFTPIPSISQLVKSIPLRFEKFI